jgi:hypothetical protein
MREMRNCCCFCHKKSEEKGLLGRLRRRRSDAIKTDVKEKGLEGVCWISLAQNSDNCRAAERIIMNLRGT